MAASWASVVLFKPLGTTIAASTATDKERPSKTATEDDENEERMTGSGASEESWKTCQKAWGFINFLRLLVLRATVNLKITIRGDLFRYKEARVYSIRVWEI